MTEIRYDRKNLILTVEGHAQSAPEGEDLVCAGVSTLVWTAIQAMSDAKGSGAVKRLEWKYEKGDAYIRVRPEAGMRSVVTLMLDTICRGFGWMEGNYGEYVSYKIC